MLEFAFALGAMFSVVVVLGAATIVVAKMVERWL